MGKAAETVAAVVVSVLAGLSVLGSLLMWLLGIAIAIGAIWFVFRLVFG